MRKLIAVTVLTVLATLPRWPGARGEERKLSPEAYRAHAGSNPGDPMRGREVFFRDDLFCKVCHRVGDVGGTIGPDLTKVGSRLSRAELIAQILQPRGDMPTGLWQGMTPEAFTNLVAFLKDQQ
jgi:hypothetical protein